MRIRDILKGSTVRNGGGLWRVVGKRPILRADGKIMIVVRRSFGGHALHGRPQLMVASRCTPSNILRGVV